MVGWVTYLPIILRASHNTCQILAIALADRLNECEQKFGDLREIGNEVKESIICCRE